MPTAIAVVEDLLFASRIREAARAAGVELRTARRADDVAEALRAGARLLLVDADGDRLPWREAIAAARADDPALPVVAFFSHVRADRGAAARAQGALALPRSAFVQQLPALLAQAAQGPEPQEKTR